MAICGRPTWSRAAGWSTRRCRSPTGSWSWPTCSCRTASRPSCGRPTPRHGRPTPATSGAAPPSSCTSSSTTSATSAPTGTSPGSRPSWTATAGESLSVVGGRAAAQSPRGVLLDPVGGGGDELAAGPGGGGIRGGRAVLQPVVRVQARLLVGAQAPVGVVELGRIVDVALVEGDLHAHAVRCRRRQGHEGHVVAEQPALDHGPLGTAGGVVHVEVGDHADGVAVRVDDVAPAPIGDVVQVVP